jgi:ATP-dependent DNA ligase
VLPPDLTPQLIANDGVKAMQRGIADPDAYAIEPKVDGVRGLLVVREDHVVEVRNRRGLSRDWFRHEPFRRGIRALADRLPILWQGSVLDGELTAGRFRATMAALYGSKEHAPALRFVVFDMPVLAGVDLRDEPWQAPPGAA